MVSSEYSLVVRVVSRYLDISSMDEVDDQSLMNIGADSLSMVEIILEIRDETGIEVPETLTTIKEIATYLEKQRQV